MSAQTMRRLGMGMFLVGIALALVIAGLSTWANTEAVYYGFPHMTMNRLTTLSCPHFIAWDEETEVRARLTNTNPYPATLGVKSWVSVPLAWEVHTEHRKLQPGETWHWSRPIGSEENRVLRHFVFVTVYTFGGYPMPQRQSMCGIYVLPVRGVRGDTVMWLALALAMLLLVGGWWLWRRGQGEAVTSTVLKWTVHFFLVLTPLTVATALWVSWALAIVLLVVNVLLIVIVGLSSLMHAS